MIHHSNAKPPQFGYISLGKGYFLTVDPIGQLISTLETMYAKKRWPDSSKRPYYHHLWHKCEFCQTEKSKRFQWANKSHEYKRVLTDWIRLCAKCHSKYDKDYRDSKK